MRRISRVIQRVPVGLPHKSDWRTSKMGYQFDCNENFWQLDGSVKINLGRMRNLDDATREGVRKALCRYAEELSAGSVRATLVYFIVDPDFRTMN